METLRIMNKTKRRKSKKTCGTTNIQTVKPQPPKQTDFHSENASDKINRLGIWSEIIKTIGVYLIVAVCVILGFYLMIKGVKDEYFDLSFGNIHLRTALAGLALAIVGIWFGSHYKSNVTIHNKK